MRLEVRIMTHPARRARAERLAESISAMNPRLVVDDDEVGTLATSRRAWLDGAGHADHVLVLQDDVVPAPGFITSVEAAVTAAPDAAISLFAEWGSRTAQLIRLAAWEGNSWAKVADIYTPSQGLVLPASTAVAFTEWSRDRAGPDDLELAAFLRRTGTARIAAVPNLLEHDDEPSLVGNGFHGLRRAAVVATEQFLPRSAATAGADLTWTPWASWMRSMAEWFAVADDMPIEWYGRPRDELMPSSLRKLELAHLFRRAEGLDCARRTLGELVLFEFWLTQLDLGLLATSAAPSSDVHRRAMATAFAGAFRRYLPNLDDETLASGFALAMHGFRTGAALQIDRPWRPRPQDHV